MPEEVGSGKRLEFGVGFNVNSGSGLSDITSLSWLGNRSEERRVGKEC